MGATQVSHNSQAHPTSQALCGSQGVFFGAFCLSLYILEERLRAILQKAGPSAVVHGRWRVSLSRFGARCKVANLCRTRGVEHGSRCNNSSSAGLAVSISEVVRLLAAGTQQRASWTHEWIQVVSKGGAVLLCPCLPYLCDKGRA